MLLVFALGVICFNLLTLIFPYTGTSFFVVACLSRTCFGVSQSLVLTYVIAWIDSTFKIQNMLAQRDREEYRSGISSLAVKVMLHLQMSLQTCGYLIGYIVTAFLIVWFE